MKFQKSLLVAALLACAGGFTTCLAAERGLGRIAVFAGPACRQAVCRALHADGFALEEATIVRELGRGLDYRGFVFMSDADERLLPRTFRSVMKLLREKYPAASALHFTTPGVESPLAAECLELFVAEKTLADLPSADMDYPHDQIRPYVKMILERGWGTDQKLAAPVREARRRILDRRTARLHDAKFGVFTHFLYWGDSADEWRKKVESFDVRKVADQLEGCGAKFYFITLMQGMRWMCAPNATYDRICGTKPGEACSVRDLPMELADELGKRGIDLYLYYTGDGPSKDASCGPKMGFAEPRNKPFGRAFVENWASVLEEYAVRYGDKVKGWWVDGCYRREFGYTDELLSIYAKAVRKGNPDALVAFNDGVKDYYFKNYEDEDFTCGEFNDFYCVPSGRYVDGAQAFALIPLGAFGKDGNYGWMCPGVKRSADYVASYVDLVTQNDGVVCIDVHFAADGTIDADQFEVLKAVGRRIRTIRGAK